MDIRNLCVLAESDGFTLWNYQADYHLNATAAGFFDDAAASLAVGDIILVTTKQSVGREGGRVGACQRVVTQTEPEVLTDAVT